VEIIDVESEARRVRDNGKEKADPLTGADRNRWAEE